MQRLPFALPSSLFPLLFTMEGFTPKNGSVAEPGFFAITPAIGDIKTEPVSVCHQVSTNSHLLLPTLW